MILASRSRVCSPKIYSFSPVCLNFFFSFSPVYLFTYFLFFLCLTAVKILIVHFNFLTETLVPCIHHYHSLRVLPIWKPNFKMSLFIKDAFPSIRPYWYFLKSSLLRSTCLIIFQLIICIRLQLPSRTLDQGNAKVIFCLFN